MNRFLAPLLRSQTTFHRWVLIFFVATCCVALVLVHVFQYVFNMQPCELCLRERWPYYIGFVFGIILLIKPLRGKKVIITYSVYAFLFFADFLLSAYHAGIEWHFWSGPQKCIVSSASLSSLSSLSRTHVNVPHCDVAAFRFLFISLAGYNALLSLFLVCVSVVGIIVVLKYSKKKDALL